MKKWLESRLDISLDDTFAFKVPVQAVVRDARLGVLQLGLVAIVFVYVAIFKIWGKCEFLAKPNIELAMRATLREPDVPRPVSQLDYCCHIDDHHCPDGNRSICQYFTGDAAFHSQVNSIAVVTKRTWYEREVNHSGYSPRTTTSAAFVADIESFTLMIEPNIFSRDIQRSGTLLQGQLYVGPDSTWEEPSSTQHELCAETHRDPRTEPDRGAPRSRAPCYVESDFQVMGNDVFRISTILRATNVSLDGFRKHGRIRETGLVIGVTMELVSWRPFKGLVNEHYIVKPVSFENSVYSQYVSHSKTDTKEISYHDKGLHLLFHVQGTLAYVSLITLMAEVTTSVALLAVAAAVVRFLAIHVLPFGRYHYHAMTLESPDIDDIQHLDGKDHSTLEEEHKQVYGRSAASKEKIVINLIEARKTPTTHRRNKSFHLLGALTVD